MPLYYFGCVLFVCLFTRYWFKPEVFEFAVGHGGTATTYRCCFVRPQGRVDVNTVGAHHSLVTVTEPVYVGELPIRCLPPSSSFFPHRVMGTVPVIAQRRGLLNRELHEWLIVSQLLRRSISIRVWSSYPRQVRPAAPQPSLTGNSAPH